MENKEKIVENIKIKAKYQEEYYEIINPILNHPEFQKRKSYQHHGKESVYEHSMKVSNLAYRMAKRLPINEKEVAIGALLHDFYINPWYDNTVKKRFLKQHGFVHAKEAKNNAHNYFEDYMNHYIDDMIEKHMFPLNIRPPRYLGSWIVTISDKCVSLSIVKDFKNLPKYIGLGKKKKRSESNE